MVAQMTGCRGSYVEHDPEGHRRHHPLSSTIQQADRRGRQMPPYGTPRRDIRPVNFGALPFIAIERRMRAGGVQAGIEVENAAVITTMFIIVPPPLDADLAEERHERASPAE